MLPKSNVPGPGYQEQPRKKNKGGYINIGRVNNFLEKETSPGPGSYLVKQSSVQNNTKKFTFGNGVGRKTNLNALEKAKLKIKKKNKNSAMNLNEYAQKGIERAQTPMVKIKTLK